MKAPPATQQDRQNPIQSRKYEGQAGAWVRASVGFMWGGGSVGAGDTVWGVAGVWGSGRLSAGGRRKSGKKLVRGVAQDRRSTGNGTPACAARPWCAQRAVQRDQAAVAAVVVGRGYA